VLALTFVAGVFFEAQGHCAVDPLHPSPPPSPARQAEIANSAAPWRARLTLPFLGVGRVTGTKESTPTRAILVPLLLFSLSRAITVTHPRNPWTLEGEVGWLFEGGNLIRNVLRLGFGPSFQLIDARDPTGRGNTLALTTQLGVTYWNTIRDFESLQGEYGAYHQDLLGGAAQLGLEGVWWTSRNAGWSARLRTVVERFFLGRPYYLAPGELGDVAGWNLAAFLDLGRAW